MDFVDRKISEFISRDIDRHDSDDELKSKLNGYLLLFNRNLDKRRFLNAVHEYVKKKHDEHLPVCKNPQNCGTNKHFEAVMFFVSQELEEILGYDDSEKYRSDLAKEDFSFGDKVKLDKRLDEVLERLEKLGLGQEIIFNEIDELRTQTELKKKSWKQMLKGKMIDLSLSKLVDNDTIEWIYKTLTDESLRISG